MRFAEFRRVLASFSNRTHTTHDFPNDAQGSIDPRFFRRPVRSQGDLVGETERIRFEEAMFVAREQLDAADLLSNAPHRTESMHVLARALSALEEAIAHLRRGLPEAARSDELLPEALTHSLQAARQRLESTPRLQVLLSPNDVHFWRTTRARARRLCSWLSALGLRRRVIIARRAILAAVFLAPLVVVLAVFLSYLRLRDPFTVSVSDYYASDQTSSPYFPEKAVDGDVTTAWLTPEGKDGWLQLDFTRKMQVNAVSIVNGRNPPYNDRGIKTLEIELFRGDEQAKRVEVTLDEEPAERLIAIAGEGITRLRVTALSHYGHGAGLAEIRVLEK